MARRKRGPTPKIERWAPFFEDSRSPLPDGTRLFGNGWWTVHVRQMDGESPDGSRGFADLAGACHLSIHDRPRSTRHDWREMQRVKTEILGAEREAVELYPAESRELDTSNEYHLWALPEGERFNFGFQLSKRTTEADLTPETLAAGRAMLGIPESAPDRSRQRRRVSEPGSRV